MYNLCFNGGVGWGNLDYISSSFHIWIFTSLTILACHIWGLCFVLLLYLQWNPVSYVFLFSTVIFIIKCSLYKWTLSIIIPGWLVVWYLPYQHTKCIEMYRNCPSENLIFITFCVTSKLLIFLGSLLSTIRSALIVSVKEPCPPLHSFPTCRHI